MGPIYKIQWKSCPEVIATSACRHLLTNSLYGQEKQKYPHACHSAHVWEMTFQKWKTEREREKIEKREGWEELCVSVPLRVPRQGPNVGKVAQCLSHDPWGKAALLCVHGWRCDIRETARRGNEHIRTSQYAHDSRSWHAVSASVWLGLRPH